MVFAASTMVFVVATKVFVSLTRVLAVLTMVFAVLTMVFVVSTMVFVVLTTVLVTLTMVFITLTTVFVVPTMVPVFSTLVFDVEKMFFSLDHLFSEAEPILRTSEASFSITEKTAGEVPAAFAYRRQSPMPTACTRIDLGVTEKNTPWPLKPSIKFGKLPTHFGEDPKKGKSVGPVFWHWGWWLPWYFQWQLRQSDGCRRNKRSLINHRTWRTDP
jgi:hypothetical protein